MKVLIFTAAVTTLLAAPAVRAQSEAEYYSYEEQAQPAGDDVDEMANAPDLPGVDVSSEGASSGESGLGEDDYDVAPPGAPVPEE